MKDHNEIFDEFIDVNEETDAETAQFLEDEEDYEDYEDGEEDEEEDSYVVRTALLAKNDSLAMLSLKATESGGQIVRFDPRESLPSMQRYESEEEALRWYRRSLATSRRNGWTVVYDGEPLIG